MRWFSKMRPDLLNFTTQNICRKNELLFSLKFFRITRDVNKNIDSKIMINVSANYHFSHSAQCCSAKGRNLFWILHVYWILESLFPNAFPLDFQIPFRNVDRQNNNYSHLSLNPYRLRVNITHRNDFGFPLSYLMNFPLHLPVFSLPIVLFVWQNSCGRAWCARTENSWRIHDWCLQKFTTTQVYLEIINIFLNCISERPTDKWTVAKY